MKKVKLSDVRGVGAEPPARHEKTHHKNRQANKPPRKESLYDEATGKLATGVLTSAVISVYFAANGVFQWIVGFQVDTALFFVVSICLAVSATLSLRWRSITAGIFGLLVFGMHSLLSIYATWISLQNGYSTEFSLLLVIALRGVALALLLRGVEGLMELRRLDKNIDAGEKSESAASSKSAENSDVPYILNDVDNDL